MILSAQKMYGFACTATDYANGLRLPASKALVINGFWRSGTTWLQETVAELLQAKSVFEPFNLPSQNILKCLPEIRPERRDFQFVNALMPYVPENFTKGSALYSVIQQSLKGQLKGRSWHRRDIKECICSNVVVKFTRASLCAYAIANTFSTPVLHLVRDPRAVITSIKQLQGGQWAEGTFNNFSLRELLLEVDDGRSEYFQPQASTIKAIDKTTDYGRLAGYYCLTEQYLEDKFKSYVGLFKVARYEDLIGAPPSAISQLLVDLGLNPKVSQSVEMDKPSSTDWGKNGWAQKVSKSDRLLGWKTQIDDYEKDLIEDIVTSFNMQDRFWE